MEIEISPRKRTYQQVGEENANGRPLVRPSVNNEYVALASGIVESGSDKVLHIKGRGNGLRRHLKEVGDQKVILVERHLHAGVRKRQDGMPVGRPNTCKRELVIKNQIEDRIEY